MRRNEDFILRDVADEHILVPVGDAISGFNGIITLNGTGVLLWELLESDCTQDQLLAAILEKFEVTAEQAQADIEAFLGILRESGCIKE